MNPTEVTTREVIAQNRYANTLRNIVPGLCRQPAIFIPRADIRHERMGRLSCYAFDRLALLPCMIVSPKVFFTAASVVYLCSLGGSLLFETKYPSTETEKAGWKAYLESTVILKPSARKWLATILIIKALSNNIFSLMYPEDMAWVNAIYMGITLGIISGRIMVEKDVIKSCQHWVNERTLTEPLLPNGSDQV